MDVWALTSSSSEQIPAEHQQGVYDQSPPRESWNGGPPHHLQRGDENKEYALYVCFLRLFFKKRLNQLQVCTVAVSKGWILYPLEQVSRQSLWWRGVSVHARAEALARMC